MDEIMHGGDYNRTEMSEKGFLWDRVLALSLLLLTALFGLILAFLLFGPALSFPAGPYASYSVGPVQVESILPPWLGVPLMVLWVAALTGIYFSRWRGFALGLLIYGASGVTGGVAGIPFLLVALYCLHRLLGIIGPRHRSSGTA